MEGRRRPRSLRSQMVAIVILGWLVPVLLVLGVMGFYLYNALGQHTTDRLSEQLAMNLSISADRLDAALAASRMASSNPAIKTGWAAYRRGGNYADLYRAASGFLDSQYRGDSRFSMAAFWLAQDAEGSRIGLYNEAVGKSDNQLRDFWEEDWSAVRALAGRLDTGIAFLVSGERVYLVRNVVASDFTPIGTLVLGLDRSYCFDGLTGLDFAAHATVYLDGQPLVVRGEAFSQEELGRKEYLSARVEGREYRLEAVIRLDRTALTAQYAGYQYILGGMLVLLIPLLVLVLRVFRRKVEDPVQLLMEGAGHIEQGELGYQVPSRPAGREFVYLTDSFNRMSVQLRYQFDRLYQEEMALRDAEIKALQSHINPHFLNNTLEIINWEARMSGDAKVSKMIEALATVLDAALDREKRPKVRLAQEMTYVNAYLYIVGERYGKRLTVEVDLPQKLMDCLVPRLILQPVIENAVEHGLSPGGQGVVAIRGWREEGFLLLEIENHGGLTPEDEARIATLLGPDCATMKQASHSIGIANVNQRLGILYGPPCGLDIRKGEGWQVIARLTIALEQEQAGE